MSETHDYELQLCEKCGAVIGTKKHLLWLYEKLGPLAYTNPALLIAKSSEQNPAPQVAPQDIQQEKQSEDEMRVSDFMRILCPECKCRLNIRL
jgi:hypothetical protein